MTASTIFRFVTVRNPKKPSKEERETGFVDYDWNLKASVVSAVAEVKNSQDPQAAIQEIMRRFKDTSEYIGNIDQLLRIAGSLNDLGEWLSREEPRLTVKKFKDYLACKYINCEPEILRALWNNLVFYIYAGGSSEVREGLITSLRATNVLTFQFDKLTDSGLQRLARATVLIPENAHVPIEPSPIRDTVKRDEDSTTISDKRHSEIIQARERLAELQAAYDDISKTYRNEIERLRSMPVPPPVMPIKGLDGRLEFPKEPSVEKGTEHPSSFLTLDDRVMKGLSKTALQVLNNLSIEAGSRIPFALKAIEDETNRAAKAAWTKDKPVQRVVQVGGAFWVATPPEKIEKPTELRAFHTHLDTQYSRMHRDSKCRVRPLGIADFRRVEQIIWCYEPGEVAHIENVLQGESKERTTRRLRRTEEIFTVATEEEVTQERDTQTADRFEIEKESSKVVESDISFDLGVQVTAQYGPVRIQADSNFAISNSTTESDKIASRYGREITERALERVTKKVREERTTKLIEEFEEINKHTLSGSSDQHIVGLYRWVDKIYQAKIVNYGKRLMFEFLVPEPAAFHLHVMTQSPIESTLTLSKPLDPRTPEAAAAIGESTPITDHTDITITNYGVWAAAYEASIEPPPPEFLTTSKAYHRDAIADNTQFADSKTDLKVIDGYQAYSAHVHFGMHASGDNWVTVFVGRWGRYATSGQDNAVFIWLHGEDDFVPVNIMGKSTFYALNVEVECKRTDEHFQKWKIKTFNAILKAYQDKLANYENALAQAKAQAGVQIRGTNPLLNREIEKLELKKGAIRLLAQYCNPLWSNAMKDLQQCGYPEFDCCESLQDSPYVQFVEQAFEWKIMTYLFYPYFWGRKCNWKKIYQLDDVDPLFLAFLQAGYARVVVPVRDGYHQAALRFLTDGTLFNGEGVPGVDSPLYVAIENEMKEPVGEVDPSIQPWEIRVPTTLTALQCESGCTPGTGLPCRRDEENN